jgi:hypothetical protein
VGCAGKEAQLRQRPLHRIGAHHEVAFDAHRIGRERKTDGGDAGRPAFQRFVEHQPVGRICLVNEVGERVALQRIQQLILF